MLHSEVYGCYFLLYDVFIELTGENMQLQAMCVTCDILFFKP